MAQQIFFVIENYEVVSIFYDTYAEAVTWKIQNDLKHDGQLIVCMKLVDIDGR